MRRHRPSRVIIIAYAIIAYASGCGRITVADSADATITVTSTTTQSDAAQVDALHSNSLPTDSGVSDMTFPPSADASEIDLIVKCSVIQCWCDASDCPCWCAGGSR